MLLRNLELRKSFFSLMLRDYLVFDLLFYYWFITFSFYFGEFFYEFFILNSRCVKWFDALLFLKGNAEFEFTSIQ